MQVAESLIDHFYEGHPDISVNFQILPENQLRPTVMRDVATQSGQFDVVMIGSYEVPLWAEKGWITNLSENFISDDADWNVEDLTQPILDIMSLDGNVYAAPFYGSSSFTFYRKDLFEAAGLTMPEKPTWAEIADFAAQLDDDASGVSGICLRGIPGWGQSLAPLTTVINTFGGRWFDENWEPQLTAPKTKEAIEFYVNLLREHGQTDAASSGWQECLQLMTQGRTAMWYDDTVFAGPVLDQAVAELEGDIGFAPAPVNVTDASGWLWAWGLAIPETSSNKEAAWEFISWVTSPEYIQLAGQEAGWAQIPPGSRKSTYEIPEYQEAAADYAELTIEAIQAADPQNPTVDPVPYTGVQYVTIPEFEQIGEFVSQQLAGAISGNQSVDAALEASETRIREIMEDAGYY
jgi:sorbitol/mannitol transport system substrate-binding protein